jgi:serine acetyltransferase
MERWVRDGVHLGEGAFVDDGAFLDAVRPWLITIGADSFISSYAAILTHDAALVLQGELTRIARVDIGSRVYVAPGAVILPGSQIGDDSIIEAGAVVRGTIPPRSYVAGNPAVVSDIAAISEDHRHAAANGRSRPYDGRSNDSEITDGRKPAPREALASARSGYLIPPSRVTNGKSAGPS